MSERPLQLVEVAEMFGVHSRTIRRWVAEKKFPAPTQFSKGKNARLFWPAWVIERALMGMRELPGLTSVDSPE